MSKQLENLLQRPMSRQEFLRTIGLGVLLVLNLEWVIRLLHGHTIGLNPHHPVSQGYSSQGYSGFIGEEPSHISLRGYDS